MGFVLVEVDLLGMHHLPRRKPFAKAALLVAPREDTPVGREMGSDPSGTRRSSNLDFSGTGTVSDPYGINCPSGPESAGSGNISNLASPESPSALLLMVEHSGYL